MFQTLPHFSSHLTSMIAQVGAIMTPPPHPTQYHDTERGFGKKVRYKYFKVSWVTWEFDGIWTLDTVDT